MADSFHFSQIEKEAIVLAAAFDLINSTVNYQVLDIMGAGQVQVGCKTSTHFNFFIIMLVDFLSKPDKTVFGLSDSYLASLSAISENPLLGEGTMVESLQQSALSFSSWLRGRATYEEAWFPSIELGTNLSIERFDIIDICGNIAKHNFTRLTRVAKDLRRIFKDNGHTIDLHQSLSIIEEFREQFHINVLNYHTTTIAAFLNEIRWGIYEYLQPVYEKSMVKIVGDPLAYKYIYPKGLEHEFARECFWELMNKVRSEPYVPRFSAPWHLRQRY